MSKITEAVTHVDILGLTNYTAVPNSAPLSSEYLIAFVNNVPEYWDGSAWSTFGSGGGSGTPSWDAIYAGDQKLAVSGTTMTFDGTNSTANVFTVTDSAAGSGHLIQITNTGSGNDINGTSDTWFVTAAGQATFVGATLSGSGGSTEFTITAGDAVLSDGSLAITDADNAASFSVTNNTATTGSVIVLAGSGVFTGSTTTSFMTLTASGLTTGTVLYMPAAALTTGKVVDIVANALTTGIVIDITSSATAITGAGRLLRVDHTGASGTSAILSEFASASADESVILKVTASAALALGRAFQVSASSMTTGYAISVPDLDALTAGYGIHVASAATAITSSGHLLYVNHTGVTSTSGVLSQFSSAATDETVIMGITASGANALGTSLAVSTATTTGNGITVTANALTAGYALEVVSSATAITSAGHLFFVSHTGTTSTSGVLSQFTSAATDETVVVGVTAAGTGDGLLVTTTGALASGKGAVRVTSSGATATGAGVLFVSQTGTPAGATSYLANFDNTGMTATNNPVAVHVAQIGTAAAVSVTTSGAVAAGAGVLTVAQTGTPTSTGYTLLVDNSGMTATNNPSAVFVNQIGTGAAIKVTAAAQSVHFYKILTSSTGGTIWMGDGTTANAALSGTAGDILINGGSNKPEYCTGTTNWTALV